MHKILFTLLLVPATSFAQKTISAPAVADESLPHVLTASSRVPFNIPGFGSKGKTICDASGNLYFNVAGMLPMSLHDTGPFLKVEADGSRHQVFKPHLDSSLEADAEQGISPDGTFYILVQSGAGASLQRFDDSGTFASSADVDLLRAVSVKHWAIQNTGFFLILGNSESAPTIKPSAHGYAAIFAPNGKLIRTLTELSSTLDYKEGTAPALEGDVAAGEDGSFYVLTSTNIVVFNQSGNLEKTISFKKPTPHALAFRIDVSGGTISLLFYTPEDQEHLAGKLEATAILLNAQDGRVTHSFKFSDSVTNNVLCYQRNEGYSFMAVEKGMAAKDVVPTH